MRRLLFWSTLPLLLPQALWVRRRTPRFAAPAGAEGGRVEARGSPDPSRAQGDATPIPPLRLVGLGDSIIAGVGATVAAECLTAQFAREVATRRGAAVDMDRDLFVMAAAPIENDLQLTGRLVLARGFRK